MSFDIKTEDGRRVAILPAKDEEAAISSYRRTTGATVPLVAQVRISRHRANG